MASSSTSVMVKDELLSDDTDNEVTMKEKADDNLSYKEAYDTELKEFYKKQQGHLKRPWTREKVLEVTNQIKNAKLAMSNGKLRTSSQYYWCAKYDVINIFNDEYLIFKQKSPEDPKVRIIPTQDYYDTLMEIHKSCKHGGRDKMLYILKNRFYIQKRAVEIFISLCPTCETKRSLPRKYIASRALISKDLNAMGKISYIDFQSIPDEDYKWILSYQDKATQFLHLRPLKTKQSNEVALELVKIFLQFGAPLSLQSYNGKEFILKVLEEIVRLWPECEVIRVSSRYPQTHDINHDIKNMIRSWMRDNNSTKWSLGCHFVQYQKNSSNNDAIGKTPYKALFGSEAKIAIKSSDDDDLILTPIKTEEYEETLVHSNDKCNEHDKHEIVPTYNISYKVINDNKLDMPLTTESSDHSSPNPICLVCQHTTIEAHLCSTCFKSVHDVCGLPTNEISDLKTMCFICKEKPDIMVKNEETGIKRAAEIIIDVTRIKILTLDVGDSILLNVPNDYHNPLNVKHINGKIVDFRNGEYMIGTKSGIINDWFSRQELQESPNDYNEIIQEIPISLQQALSNQWLLGSPGFNRCSCKPAPKQCQNNRCACFKNKVICGSRCHSKLSCVNK